jgi:hypothetical protein
LKKRTENKKKRIYSRKMNINIKRPLRVRLLNLIIAALDQIKTLTLPMIKILSQDCEYVAYNILRVRCEGRGLGGHGPQATDTNVRKMSLHRAIFKMNQAKALPLKEIILNQPHACYR